MRPSYLALALTVAGCGMAAAAPPTGVSFSAAGTATATAVWVLDTPSTQTPSMRLSDDPTFTTVLSSGIGTLGQQTSSYINLSPNTSYYFKVKVSSDADTEFSAIATTVTLAAVPGGGSFTAVAATSFTVNWTSGGNPGATLYQVQIASDAGFTANLQTQQTTAFAAAFSNLAASTSYYARVRAFNHAATPTAYNTFGPVLTGLYDPQQGQTLIAGASQEFVLAIPAGAFAEPYTISIGTDPLNAPLSSPSLPQRILAANATLGQNSQEGFTGVLQGKTIEILAFNGQGANIGATLAQETRLTIGFTAINGDVVAGLPVRAKTLAIYHLSDDNVWIRLPSSTVDVANQTVTATTPLLSAFSLIGTLDVDLSAAFAYPVPFRPSQGHTRITFANLSQVGTIRVFTVGGRLVRKLEVSDGTGLLAWDVTDSDGRGVPSGVYFYLIESGSQKKTGKLMVIR